MLTLIPQDSGVPVGPSFAFDWTPGPLKNNQTLGEFKLGTLPPPMLTGAFDLFAVGVSGGMNFFGHASTPAGESAVEGIQITLHAGVDVKGHVTILPGKKSPDPIRAVPIDLESMTRVPFETGCHNDALEFACRNLPPPSALQSNGNFMLRSIPDGSFAIIPNLPSGMYLADVRQAGASIIDTGLAIENGRPPSPIEVIVSPNGATVEGILCDANLEPVPLSRVVLVPEVARRRNFGLFRSVRTDMNGHFSINSIPPGNYEVFGWLNADDGAWTNPAFLEANAGKGTAVGLKDGDQRTDLRVNLIP
jgi:hypothetical protein